MSARTARGVLAAVLAVAAMLLLLEVRGAGPGDALRGLAGAVAGPPERAMAWLRQSAADRFTGAAEERDRAAALERELAEARAAAGAAALGVADERHAQALAQALTLTGYRPVTARVVARTVPQDLLGALAVSTGSRQGVAAGMAAVGLAGVVGFVDTVSPGVSTLRLTTDPATRLAVRVLPSGELGVLQGTGGEARLTLLDPLGAMTVTDRVVTVGTADGLVPADLPVGSVTAIDGSAADLSRAASVEPATDASTLDRVAVLVPAGVS